MGNGFAHGSDHLPQAKMDAVDFNRQLNIAISNILLASSKPCRKNLNKRKKKKSDRRRKNLDTLPQNPVRAPLLIALGACVGIGISRFDAIALSFRQLSNPIAIAQTAQPQQPQQPIKRPLEIQLTITDPEDLKVKEGQQVSKGQVLSDRTKERDRLTRQKTLTENAIKTLNNTQFLPPPEPKPLPAPQPLPPISLEKEEAAIASAELKLRQAKRAYALELELDPFLRPMATLEAAKREWEMAIAASEQAQEILTTIAAIDGNDIEIDHHQHKLNETLREQGRREAIYLQKEAELREAQHLRAANLAKLRDAIAQAQSNYDQAQANYSDARNERTQKEYEHRLMETRRVEEVNKAASVFASQKAAYQNSLLRKDQQLFNYRERLDAINLDLEKISVVRSRYDGTIQRVRTTNQNDNTINVTVVLVPGQSDRSTTGGNPFNSITGDDGNLTAPNGGNPFDNLPD